MLNTSDCKAMRLCHLGQQLLSGVLWVSFAETECRERIVDHTPMCRDRNDKVNVS